MLARSITIKTLWGYLVDRENRSSLAFVLLGGYSVVLAIWEYIHRSELQSYLLRNEIPPSESPDLFLLVGGAFIGLIVWVILGVLISALSTRPLAPTMGKLSALFLVGTLLPFLPVLSLVGLFPLGLEDNLRATLLIIIALAMAFIVGLSVQEWRRHSSRPGIAPSSALPVHDLARALLVLMVAAYIAVMTVFALLNHASLETKAFDLAIQDQAVHSILEWGYPRVTIYNSGAVNPVTSELAFEFKDGPVNQFSDHFAPIYYLIAPFYSLVGDARALLIIQTVILGLAAFPIFGLSYRLLGSDVLAIALAASYLLHPSVHGANMFDFHEIALAPLFLLSGLYFFERERPGWMLFCLLLAMTTKEEVPLTVAMIGGYIWLARGRTKWGLTLSSVAVLYFLGVNKILMPALGGGADLARFEVFAGSREFTGVIQTLVGNPLYTIYYTLLDPDKLVFILTIFAPVLFLPLLARGRWLIALPALAVILLANFYAHYSLFAHYAVILVPSIYYLTIGGLQSIDRRRWAVPVAAAIVSASLVINSQYGYLGGHQMRRVSRPSDHDRALTELMQSVPSDASISTLNNLSPHLTTRDEVYLFPVVDGAEYILFDSDIEASYWPLLGDNARSESIAKLVPYLERGMYGLIAENDGGLLFKRGADTSRNEEILRTLLSASYTAEQLLASDIITYQPDPDSLSGISGISTAHSVPTAEPIALSYGPYGTLPLDGRYVVEYRLKLTDPPLEGEVGYIDVHSFEAGGIVTSRLLTASDFVPGAYMTFTLEVTLETPIQDAEYRVFHMGQGTLWLDQVSVTYLGD